MSWRHLQTLASLGAPVRMPVERLVGSLVATGDPVVMTHAGDPRTADFIAGALFEVRHREVVGSLGSPLALRGAGFRATCSGSDLVTAEVPRAWASCLPEVMQLCVPAWVSQEIGTTAGAPLVLPAALRKEVSRHCRRQGYELHLSAHAADLQRFHATLYRPYVTERFGAGAVLVEAERFLAVARDMTLAVLKVADEWVAGVLLDRRGDTLHLGWFGSATVPPRPGASEVLDARVIEWAAASGARRVVMGHSRPSLADGVVRYKARFGATLRPTRFPQRAIGLGILRGSPALAASIATARFVTFREGRACVFEVPPRGVTTTVSPSREAVSVRP
jgi:hypothetical protein